MRVVIQRVRKASVTINGNIHSSIGPGLLVLLGIEDSDSTEDVAWLCGKICQLRIFNDEQGVMNRSVADINGEVLLVSQFTLCADCTHGRRPSFTRSAPPAQANELYEYFTRALGEQGVSHIETGVFGADMAVTLLNDGPVTIILDTKDLK